MKDVFEEVCPGHGWMRDFLTKNFWGIFVALCGIIALFSVTQDKVSVLSTSVGAHEIRINALERLVERQSAFQEEVLRSLGRIEKKNGR